MSCKACHSIGCQAMASGRRPTGETSTRCSIAASTHRPSCSSHSGTSTPDPAASPRKLSARCSRASAPRVAPPARTTAYLQRTTHLNSPYYRYILRRGWKRARLAALAQSLPRQSSRYFLSSLLRFPCIGGAIITRKRENASKNKQRNINISETSSIMSTHLHHCIVPTLCNHYASNIIFRTCSNKEC